MFLQTSWANGVDFRLILFFYLIRFVRFEIAMILIGV
jgi:hypothetical protein